MFIGEKEVLKEEKIESELPYEVVELTLEGQSVPIKMAETLYKAIAREDKGEGVVSDVINHHFASKFLLELADAGLEHYMVENVATAMRVLAHNSRESLLRKAFNCSSGDTILLSLSLDAATGDEKID